MPHVQRSSDVVEIHGERAITFWIGAIVSIGASILLIAYRGGGMFVPLATIILIIGLSFLGYGAYCAMQIRKVKYIILECPFCQTGNALDGEPTDDFLCVECHRLIPIKEGKVLPVSQVRCGYCNALNYYSEKTDVLLCEACNHEVPISHEDGHVSSKQIPVAYTIDDDSRPYELDSGGLCIQDRGADRVSAAHVGLEPQPGQADAHRAPDHAAYRHSEAEGRHAPGSAIDPRCRRRQPTPDHRTGPLRSLAQQKNRGGLLLVNSSTCKKRPSAF